MKIALVLIGYNRKDAYARLVQSLLSADYQGDSVDLLLSIDYCENQEVRSYAEKVQWPYGEKYVHAYQERQGLRNHILKCGKFLDQYDAIVVLEDDIIVSPSFYTYAKQCVEKYKDTDMIAGISLYTHLLNVDALYPFIPHSSAHDVFFMQYAQSWGQIWMKKQWEAFADWYDRNKETFEVTSEMPQNLNKWGKNSWLKYHIKYCIEEKKYFVYPYNSLTTCCTETGTHSKEKDNCFHVPMCTVNKDYRLPDFGDCSAVYYDAFFERKAWLHTVLGIPEKDLTVDIYGKKEKMDGQTKYLLTSRILGFKILKSYALDLRPHEDNILYEMKGEEIFLYDTTCLAEMSKSKKDIKKQFVYYYRISGRTVELIKVAAANTWKVIRSRIRK